ncbi:MAG TPA: AsmA family protein, partial [Gammaproteobacteria bacterium]
VLRVSMRKFLKISGIVLGILVLLIVAAAIALPLLVEPNDFKPRIVSAVEGATGRNLEIPGDIDLSVFPWLGVELGAVRLGNAEGFGKEPFASVEGVQVRVKLLPLLGGNIEIGKVVVEQPVIRLAKNAQGRSNWEDLAEKPAEAPPEPAVEETAAPEFSVDGIEIRGAHIIYTDAPADMNAELTGFDLEAGTVGLPADFPLSMRGAVKLSNPALAATFEFKGLVAADPESRRFSVADGRFAFDAEGAALPVPSLAGSLAWQRIAADMNAETAEVQDLRLQALGLDAAMNVEASGLSSGLKASGTFEFAAEDLAVLAKHLGDRLPEGMMLNGAAGGDVEFRYDQPAGSAVVPGFSLHALGMNVDGKASASNLNEAANVKGELHVAEFSPGQLLVKLGQELPATRDGEVLDKASLSAGFQATPDSVAVENLRVVLDQSNITGRVAVTSFKNLAARFDLALDQIDVDRYLPPAEEEAAATEEPATPLDQIEIPAELVRGHDIVGELTIARLKAFGFNSTDVKIGVTARNDKLRIHPAQAKFYGGGYSGDIRLDASGKVPVVSVDEHVNNVQLMPMVKDFMEVENISGTANIDVTATARGGTVGEMRETLDGRFNVEVADGAFEGFNLWESIREAHAKFKGRSYESDAPNRTEFAELSASGTIAKGIVHNDDLLARLPFLRVTGSGDINIAAATMDYTIEATVLKSPELSGGIEELADVAIPVHLTGPVMDPSIRPDVKGVLEAKAREALERKKQELREEAERREQELREEAERREQELREEARRKAEEEKQRLEDKLEDKLKDFFN